ncbi:M6 family metalloprotease domain-containing protein [Desulfovibrio inopinatus]|uniref:M6 family metalloprotease domain-containing protein n=1 Tax=Desulfovibrio inopinatus TaxID=102109 RepID=UPI00041A4EAD|nr:M6 family metalloprotease domain-containing protein [Desulfovibrio inopinatus]
MPHEVYCTTRRQRCFLFNIPALTLWIVCLALISGSNAFAVPASPKLFTLTQPDGETFTARLRGDEHNRWTETRKGYSVIQDKSTGIWEYAQKAQGRLTLSGHRVMPGKAVPQGMLKHLRPDIRKNVSATPILSSRASSLDVAITNTWTATPVSGSKGLLILLVQFTNKSLSTTSSEWYNVIFNTSNSKSAASYYRDNSLGKMYLTAIPHSVPSAPTGVIGVTVNVSHPNDGLSSSSNYDLEKTWLQAVLIAVNPYVNFDAYDDDHDGKLEPEEMVIHCILAGYEASGSYKTPSVWAHAWNSTENNPVLAGSKVLTSWSVSGELDDSSQRHPIGVIVHELGHSMCGLPDLYDTSGTNQGMGIFSLMASGSWGANSGESEGTTPVMLDAWSRQYLGWVTPQTPTGGETLSFPTPLTTASSVAKLRNTQGSTTEYFLAENRYPTSWDLGMRKKLGSSWSGGLLIQHIDDTVGSLDNNDINMYRSTGHQGVVPEQASTQSCDMLRYGSSCEGSVGTLFYTGNNNLFTNDTSPSSANYNGTDSGIKLKQISSPSSSMSASLGPIGSCSYTLTPTASEISAESRVHGLSLYTSGGCEWTARSNAPWMTITSASSGTGTATILFYVDENTSTTPRSGTLTIADMTYTLTQQGVSCEYTISPTASEISAEYRVQGLSLYTNDACSWTAQSNDSWMTITSATSGTGTSTILFHVDQNTSPDPRSGTLTIQGIQYTLTQEGAPTYTITASAGSGGSISPNGKVAVIQSTDQTFTITPDNGMLIRDVLVDSQSVGDLSSYTFTGVTADHSIEALFEQELNVGVLISILDLVIQ